MTCDITLYFTDLDNPISLLARLKGLCLPSTISYPSSNLPYASPTLEQRMVLSERQVLDTVGICIIGNIGSHLVYYDN